MIMKMGDRRNEKLNYLARQLEQFVFSKSFFKARTYEWRKDGRDWVSARLLVRLRVRHIIGNELSGTKAFSRRTETTEDTFICIYYTEGDVTIQLKKSERLQILCFGSLSEHMCEIRCCFCPLMNLGHIKLSKGKWKLLHN